MAWPVVDRPPLALPASTIGDAELWETVILLGDLLPEKWTLIGGQMVRLHGLEHGATPPRVSTDIDTLVNLRAFTRSLVDLATVLGDLGFRLDGVSPDGLAYRYRRAGVSVDVLAPEGLGLRADLRVRPPSPERSVEVSGGTQALQRTEWLPVRVSGRSGRIPRPALTGALMVKLAAVDIDDLPDAQRTDVAFLLSLVDDPFSMAAGLRTADRRRLRRRRELLDPRHPAWRSLPDEDADRGRAALGILMRSV